MKHIFPILIVSLAAWSCAENRAPQSAVHNEENAVYYWKTVFHPDSADMAFIKRHDVGRVYLRMFDILLDGEVIPNASVKVNMEAYRLLTDSLSNKEFVPVVYITLDALKAVKGQEGELASKIATRVRNMCEYNALPNVGELQLDCDWTATTESSFFSLCDSVKQSLASLGLPWRLSSTIRLHQLMRKVPPVDNGVLMVYNTGSFDNPDAENSIISLADVEPYVKHLSNYPLHLDVAYPTYSWQLLFRKRQFLGLVNGLNLADSTQFTQGGNHVYSARRDIPYNNRIIRAGDMVRQETSPYNDILAVKNCIERQLIDRPHSNILYHLDSKILSKYMADEIDNLYSTNH